MWSYSKIKKEVDISDIGVSTKEMRKPRDNEILLVVNGDLKMFESDEFTVAHIFHTMAGCAHILVHLETSSNAAINQINFYLRK